MIVASVSMTGSIITVMDNVVNIVDTILVSICTLIYENDLLPQSLQNLIII